MAHVTNPATVTKLGARVSEWLSTLLDPLPARRTDKGAPSIRRDFASSRDAADRLAIRDLCR